MIWKWNMRSKLNIGEISLFWILNLRFKLDLERMECFSFMSYPWK